MTIIRVRRFRRRRGWMRILIRVRLSVLLVPWRASCVVNRSALLTWVRLFVVLLVIRLVLRLTGSARRLRNRF